MKKSFCLITALSAVLFLAGCSNSSDSSSGNIIGITPPTGATTPPSATTPTTVDKNEGITETGIKFKGKGDKTISVTADKINAARAISADESLKSILNENKLTQSLDFTIVYKDKKITYEEFTGFSDAETIGDSVYGENQPYATKGPLHKFNDYDFVWVTYPTNENYDGTGSYPDPWYWDGNDTVVVVRFGDWDGSEINIENVIEGMDLVRITYQIGVLDDVVAELNSPRFYEWTAKAQDLVKTSGSYLNCYVNDTAISESEIDFWGRKWTDTAVTSDEVYGIQFKVYCKDVNNMSIRYTCDGTKAPYLEDTDFLSTQKNGNGGIQNWWCASKEMLGYVPESLRQDLPNWETFYDAAE